MTDVRVGGRLFALAAMVIASSLWSGPAASAQTKAAPWDKLGERALWNKLVELREERTTKRAIKLQQIVKFSEALARRFPESQFRDDALIMKLGALAGLAGTDPYYVPELYYATDTISCELPTGKLASENDYYAIQAFVFAARLEGMPFEQQLQQTKVLYESFLKEHPYSQRKPVIMASLVRNYLRLEKTALAVGLLQDMKDQLPKHPALHRATGEYNRYRALNQPFNLVYAPEEGDTIQTADHAGRVLLIHLWTGYTNSGIQSFNTVAKLYREYTGKPLDVISVNLDRDRTRADTLIKKKNIPWKQAFDKRGLRAPLLDKYGIYFVPGFFVVDANGILRYLDSGDGLEEKIAELMTESVKTESKG
ncbi:MAG: TlpA family protein disulfide reductase [Phycisphaerae bacterium]